MKHFRPLYDRVLVSRIEQQEMSGGLYIPDAAKEKPQEGVVVAVGHGRPNQDNEIIPLQVKVDEHVLFGKYAGTEIKLNGEEFLIMREEEILGIVPK